eukprot:Hpha_TRINITY_DN13999_c0_g1::TRINITY_DN13999_c0_g1_i1::g.35829::m.35829
MSMLIQAQHELAQALKDAQPDSSCDLSVLKLDDANDIIMGLLTLGTFLSFLPMWFTIGLARSSAGVSVTTMLLLNMTNWLSSVGVGLQNWQRVLCCGQWSSEGCVRSLIPVCLVVANVFGVIPILFLTVIFFQREGEEAISPKAQSRVSNKTDRGTAVSARSSRVSTAHSLVTVPQQIGYVEADIFKTKAQSWIAVAIQIVLMIVTVGISALLLHKYGVTSNAISKYAAVCNIAAGVTQAISWLPQIYMTFKTKEIGNLSIITVLIQAPGAAIVAISMVTSGQNLDAVTQYVVTFICMMVLLFECLYYVAKRRPPGAPLCSYVCRHAIMRECINDELETYSEDESGNESPVETNQ